MPHLFLILCHLIHPIQLGITSPLIPLSLFLKLLLELLKFPLEVLKFLLEVLLKFPLELLKFLLELLLKSLEFLLKQDPLRTSTQGVASKRKMTKLYYSCSYIISFSVLTTVMVTRSHFFTLL